MSVEEMLALLEDDNYCPSAGDFMLSHTESSAIAAKLRAAEELAKLVKAQAVGDSTFCSRYREALRVYEKAGEG